MCGHRAVIDDNFKFQRFGAIFLFSSALIALSDAESKLYRLFVYTGSRERESFPRTEFKKQQAKKRKFLKSFSSIDLNSGISTVRPRNAN